MPTSTHTPGAGMPAADTETRTHVTYLYPGSFFPEESGTQRARDASVAEALRLAPDDRWYAAEFSTQVWRRWTSGSDEKWMPREGQRPIHKRRVLVGEVFSADGIRALPGDHAILLANMQGNGWSQVVRTRAGNFQPVEDGDIAISAEEARR